MTTLFKKWWAVFNIYFQDGIAYRASGLIWITTDLVTAVTMPLVWAAASKYGAIKGFDTGDFVLYYLCLLLVGSFITSHMMWEIAMEIKEGQFSNMLVRPISFYQFTFLRNLSWRIIRTCLFAPFFVLLLFAYRSYLHDVHLNIGAVFWASFLMGHLVSFTVVMMMAMIALFIEEAMAVFELYYFPMLFLSGTLFPVSMLPTWASNIAKFLPFYYTTGAPTEIMIGRLTGAAATQALGIQVVWCVLAYLMTQVLWRKGLKHYNGVGM